MEGNDALAVGFSRLLLLSDPSALPVPVEASADAAWDYYKRNWRPGAPHPEKWRGYWLASGKALADDQAG